MALPSGRSLLAITECLLMDIYSIWLLLEDVCRLDSAICSKKFRPDFLRIVSFDLLLFLREGIDISNRSHPSTRNHRYLRLSALNWIRRRGIHLATLRLPPAIKIDEREQECICGAIVSLINSQRLVKLETIDFNGCSYLNYSDMAVFVINDCYKSLKCIDIKGIYFPFNLLTCSGLEAIATHGWFDTTMVPLFEKCRRLRRFALLDPAIYDLSDDTLRSIASHSRFIEHLNLGNCPTIRDGQLITIIRSCPLIRVFCIDNSNISDASVLAIGENLPGLRQICLRNNSIISSRAIETLASKCPMLESIDLTQCPNMGDTTLIKIADHCSAELQGLSVYRCHSVTAIGLAYVKAKCSKLRRVGVQPDVLNSLRERFPYLGWVPW